MANGGIFESKSVSQIRQPSGNEPLLVMSLPSANSTRETIAPCATQLANNRQQFAN